MMMALDAGAEDFVEEEDSYEILTTPEDFSVVREALEKENVEKRKSWNVIRDSIPAIPDKYKKLIVIDAKERYGFSFTNRMRLTG